MKRTNLNTKTIKELKTLAVGLGIKRPSVTKKHDLIAEILAAEKIKGLKTVRTKKTIAVKASPLTRRAAAKTRTPKTPKKAAPKPVFQPQEYKFASSPCSQPANRPLPYEDLGELPDFYGTGYLFLTARDPHCLYAYWDYTWTQLGEMRRAAANGDLKLRIHAGSDSHSPVVQDISINQVSHDWLVKVDQANTDYYAEFGYYDTSGHFKAKSRSQSVHTPPDKVSDVTNARFVTIPFNITFKKLFELVKTHFKKGEELADVLHRLQREGFPFPFEYLAEGDWDKASDERLQKLFARGILTTIRSGSLEVTHWLRPTTSGSPH